MTAQLDHTTTATVIMRHHYTSLTLSNTEIYLAPTTTTTGVAVVIAASVEVARTGEHEQASMQDASSFFVSMYESLW